MNGMWYFVFQCVAPKDTVSEFEYTVTFEKRPKGASCIKITHSSLSIKEAVNEIHTSCKCVKLPLDVVECYVLEGDLLYFLEINKM
jgi:hypothetical protein